LERAGRLFEERIAKHSKGDQSDSQTVLALAHAYFDYAGSGIHDEAMAAFYFRSAEQFAGRVTGMPDGVWLRAMALARLKEYDEAERALATLDEAEQKLAHSCLARADVAFRRRDFATARAEAEQLRQGGGTLPEWLAALEAQR
jgi:hypothetical protein